MAESHDAVTEAELHAYLDDELPEERRRVVEHHLAKHPDDARRLDRYRAHAALAARAYAPLIDRPVPLALLPLVVQPGHAGSATSPWRWCARAAVVLLTVAAGAGAGWFARPWYGQSTEQAVEGDSFVADAVAAHRVYAPEIRHPVEVGADEKDQLAGWLSKRLGVPLKPASEVGGYRLVGGRLLPGRGRPAAQFLYEDAVGHRITLYCQPLNVLADTTLEFVRAGPIGSYYWSEHGLGWAVSGELDRQDLLSVATSLDATLD
jgi:anti-sigma factor RsiW